MFKIVDGIEVPLTEEEISEFEARQAEAAMATAIQTADEARSERNALLAETDWRFRSDMNPSQEWVDYCQALRDVPSQPGFPNDIVWPTKPE